MTLPDLDLIKPMILPMMAFVVCCGIGSIKNGSPLCRVGVRAVEKAYQSRLLSVLLSE